MEKYHRAPVMDYMAVSGFAGNKDFDVGQPDRIGLKKSFEIIDRRVQRLLRPKSPVYLGRWVSSSLQTSLTVVPADIIPVVKKQLRSTAEERKYRCACRSLRIRPKAFRILL